MGAGIEPTAICVTSIIERSQFQAGESALITRPGPISLISKGVLPIEKIITHKLPLEKWEKAFHFLEGRHAAKIVLIP